MDVSWPITVLGTGNLDPEGVRFLLCTIKVYIGIITCILYFFFRNSKLLFKYEYETKTKSTTKIINSTAILQTHWSLQNLKNAKCGRVKFCEMQKAYIAFFTFSFSTWYMCYNI